MGQEGWERKKREATLTKPGFYFLSRETTGCQRTLCHSLANYSVTFDSSRCLNGRRLFPQSLFQGTSSVYLPLARVIIDSTVRKKRGRPSRYLLLLIAHGVPASLRAGRYES